MKDERFIYTVFDFSLYFLRQKQELTLDQKRSGLYSAEINQLYTSFPAAIHATLDFKRKGNFLSLLDYKFDRLIIPEQFIWFSDIYGLDKFEQFRGYIPEFDKLLEDLHRYKELQPSSERMTQNARSILKYLGGILANLKNILDKSGIEGYCQFMLAPKPGYVSSDPDVTTSSAIPTFSHVLSDSMTDILNDGFLTSLLSPTYDALPGIPFFCVSGVSIQTMCDHRSSGNPMSLELAKSKIISALENLRALESIVEQNYSKNLKNESDTTTEFYSHFANFYDYFKPLPGYTPISNANKHSSTLTVSMLERFLASNENSSTNFNRRRASKILKTYFCDDLTPIGVESPDQHFESDSHASDPSCKSCHYKLDPMAGFFRNYGVAGINFAEFNVWFTAFSSQGVQLPQIQAFFQNKKTPVIMFDDNLVISDDQYYKYINSWKNPPGTSPQWNIGYVVSTTDKSKNFYGESIDNLFAIIKKAPAVKQCLTRRMAEYFLGRNQVFDQAWLLKLNQHWTDEPNSSEAFTKIVKELALSNTFLQRDPISSQCYDFGSDSQKKSEVPCEVSFIIQRNCNECHGRYSWDSNLQLDHYVDTPTGRGFPNRENGKILSHAETLKRMLERLSSTDSKKRMPYKKSMDPEERNILFLWLNREIDKLPAGEKQNASE